MAKGRMQNTKTIRVLLVQPPSEDRETLLRLMSRVGFLTKVCWPPSSELFLHTDVVFAAFRPIFEENKRFLWNAEDPPAALVALLDFENPAIVNEVVRMNSHAVLGMPISSFGVVANVFVALQNYRRQINLTKQNRRWKARIESDKLLTRAKGVLIHYKGMSEEEAHKTLRRHAMNKRVSIQEIAKSIVNAEEIFTHMQTSDLTKSK